MLSAKRLPSQQTFSDRQGRNKDNRSNYEMTGIKQQTFILRIAGVHSSLERRVSTTHKG